MTTTTGPVLRPDDDGYDAERRGFNLVLDDRPALVVGAADARDVAYGVRHAADSGRGVAVLATGHGVSVRADDQVVIGTRRMRSVEIDPDARTARVGPGAVWQEVVDAAAPFGLAPLSGSHPGVGAVGYTLGGGIGLLGRRYGYASDHVRAFEAVTADGRLREASAHTEPDLWWALRGGKGNFGVVTSMLIDLFPLSRIFGGGLYFGADAVERALHAYCSWAATVPPEMSSSAQLIRYPDLPVLPEPLRGRFALHLRFAYCGATEEGEELVRPLRQAGPLLLDTLRELPYQEAGSIHHEPDQPMATYDRTLALDGAGPQTADALLAQAGPGTEAPYIAELRHHGGAYARPQGAPGPVGGRDAGFLLFSTSLVGAEGLAPARAAHDTLHRAMKPWSTGGTFVNFLGVDDAAPERVRTAYPAEDYGRLRAVKAAYDPENLFRINYNIPPEA